MAISKWNGVALSSINKINGVLVSNIAKINGISIAAAYAYLLDTYGTSVEAAYSLRRVGDSSYTGDAVRIREDGTNTETDIGFTGTNGEDLDIEAIATHCGSNNGYIVKWYDQSGGTANDLSQSTTANQPQIWDGSVVLTGSAGNYVIEPDDSNDVLNTTTDPITGTTNRTDFILGEVRGLNGVEFFGDNNSGSVTGDRWTTGMQSTNYLLVAVRGETATATSGIMSANTAIQATYMLDGSQLQDISIWKDGTSLTMSYSSPTQALNTNSGAYSVASAGGGASRVRISEIIRYSAAKSTDRTNIESNISTYWNPLYLLDSYGEDIAAAYSLRRLNRGAVWAVRIRRDNDNAEQDIGFVGEDLDATAISDFCTTNNGYVVKWYSQANSSHLTQTTTSAQPQIYNGSAVLTNVNGDYAIKFDDSDDQLTIASDPITGTTNRTEFLLGQLIDDTVRQSWGGNTSGATDGSRWSLAQDSVSVGKLQLGTRNASSTGSTSMVDTSVYNMTVMLNGSQQQDIDMWINSSAETMTHVLPTTSINTASGIFKIPSATTLGNIYLSEWIRYSAAKTTDRASIESNQSSYWDVT